MFNTLKNPLGGDAGFHDREIHSVDLGPAAATTVRKIRGAGPHRLERLGTC